MVTLENLSKRTKILYVMALVATIATTGSLYLSLGLGLVPCELCWYQRILMYPLVPILVYAGVKDINLYQLVSVFVSIGIVISGYHSYIQVAPSGHNVCSTLCAITLYKVGPFTIPNLSFIAFVLLGIGTIYLAKQE